jgi:hypothetical protein
MTIDKAGQDPIPSDVDRLLGAPCSSGQLIHGAHPLDSTVVTNEDSSIVKRTGAQPVNQLTVLQQQRANYLCHLIDILPFYRRRDDYFL